MFFLLITRLSHCGAKSSNHVVVIHMDGTNKFCLGCLEAHLHSRGIAMQVTAPDAHLQNRKIECYIWVLEDGFQTLLADSNLSISFWGDAILTVAYICNQVPMSVLPSDTTPYEEMEHSKPNLSSLQVWGCQCFISIPPELCLKGGPHHFKAIFVGYEENQLGWCIRDLNSKYHFSCDVSFNDLVPGLLSSSIPFHLLPPLILLTSSLIQLRAKHSMMLLSFKTITIQEALWICLFLTLHRLLVSHSSVITRTHSLSSNTKQSPLTQNLNDLDSYSPNLSSLLSFLNIMMPYV